MVVFKRKVLATDPRFRGRSIQIMTASTLDVIPVGDTEVICNGCNANIYDSENPEAFGWLIYLSKLDLKKDRPYDIYCDECATRSFPKAEKA